MSLFEIFINPNCSGEAFIDLPLDFEDVYAYHKAMATYEITPLQALSHLAKQLNIKGLYVKDESQRFGLNAFKGLGVSYALGNIIKRDPRESYTFVSCTDGNHGKALAWMAQQMKQTAIIFMPKGSELRRVKAIEAFGAKVHVTEMNYDDTVRYAAKFAEENAYYLVQDTTLEGYTQIPNDIVMGYATMVREALEQMNEKPTHVFVQAGVGSMAGGVVWYLLNHLQGQLPHMGVIESDQVACIFESVKSNQLVSIGGEPVTIMAGLNCGEPNFVTWPLLKTACGSFIKCSDEVTLRGMARAKAPFEGDLSFSSGESGAVGLGFIEALLSHDSYEAQRKAMGIDEQSVILLFNTEGELETTI